VHKTKIVLTYCEKNCSKVGRPYLTRRIVIEVSLSLSKGSEMICPSVFLTSSNTQTEIQVLNQFLM
jgi:hypothetical protein